MKILHRILTFLAISVLLIVTACGPSAAEKMPGSKPTSTPQQPGLRDLARAHGRHIGIATYPAAFDGDPVYARLAAQEFDLVTPETALKFEIVHPEKDRYDFRQADRILAFAQEHSMVVRGHPLVWDLQLPAWLLNGNFSQQEMRQILHDHIQTLVSRYRGQFIAWDVVNEPFDENGSLRETIWMKTIGPEYIALAFRWAHEADPGALLFLNEQAAEGLNAKSQAVYVLARGLLQDGVPIDGIGIQMHTFIGGKFSATDLKANMRRLEDLGLVVHITEMDVRTQYVEASQAAKLLWQGQLYRDVMRACLEVANCQALVTWGLSDANSWIPGFTGHDDMPLLFDKKYQPKPAYYAVRQALLEGPQSTPPAK